MQNDINEEKTGKQKYEQKVETDAQIDKKIADLDKLNEWYGYPVAENKMQAKGITFKQPYQQGKIDFEIYYDESEQKHYSYYNDKIHSDFAWKWDEPNGEWKQTEKSKPVKEGLLYINPAYKIAIYYYKGGGGTFNVFKVKIIKVAGK